MLEAGVILVGFLQIAVALLMIGAAPAFTQRYAMSHRQPAVPLWLWLFGAVLLGAFLIVLALPADAERFLVERLSLLSDGWSLATVRVASFLCVAAAGMLISVGWWDRVYVLGSTRGMREMTQLISPTAIVGGVGAVLVAFWPQGRAGELPLPVESADKVGTAGMGCLYLVAIFLFVGLNAGGVARALANRGLDRVATLLIAVVPTLMAVFVTYLLFTLMLYHAGTNWAAAQVLLGAGGGETLGLGSLIGRWSLGYLLAVLLLGCGGWAGIRFAPRPRVQPTLRSAPVVITQIKEPVVLQLTAEPSEHADPPGAALPERLT